MKYFMVTICFLLCVSVAFASGKKHSDHADHDHDKKEKTKEVKVQVKGTQKTCPITGKKINGSFIIFQGQKVQFCCQGCDKKFLKKTTAGFEKLAKNKEITDNVQVKCPVSGDVLEDRKHKVSLKGHNIYFCCKDCIKDFNAKPEKFLKGMSGKKAVEKKAHGGHDHGNHKH